PADAAVVAEGGAGDAADGGVAVRSANLARDPTGPASPLRCSIRHCATGGHWSGGRAGG
ncbi:MAG: hypothetical protein K0R11_1914, partial [Acidimicrobiales bacterium]|nr:hypothetical protein [Acidimicrobiales bacterium]